jgi:cell division protein FtsZ
MEAVKQALHHPLLDDISINHAAGIIANFTAGSDLTLVEVGNALNYLQEQANPQTEIVMGTTVDDRMGDRVQIILIVTGLGSSPLEEVIAGAEQKINISHPVMMPTTSIQPQEPEIRRIPQVATTNLDLPAFMRRQPRYAGH